MTKPDHLLVLGAAGQMTSVATRLVCAGDPALRVTLADRDPGALARLAAQLGSGRAQTAALDLFDESALRRAVEGASFVINGAGPFHRTAGPVMRACIAAGQPVHFAEPVSRQDDHGSLRGDAPQRRHA